MATKARRFIPDGYHTVTPYLVVRGATKAIDFYKRAFNANELFRMPTPDGRVGHAELRIGDRSGTIRDPFGHQWTLSTHKEDVSPEEMSERMAKLAPK